MNSGTDSSVCTKLKRSSWTMDYVYVAILMLVSLSLGGAVFANEFTTDTASKSYRDSFIAVGVLSALFVFLALSVPFRIVQIFSCSFSFRVRFAMPLVCSLVSIMFFAHKLTEEQQAKEGNAFFASGAKSKVTQNFAISTGVFCILNGLFVFGMILRPMGRESVKRECGIAS
jgi:pheromone shutdown protein TraB